MNEKNEKEALFYSKDWEQARKFSLSVLPHFDILITKEFLYLIFFPKNLAHGIAGVFALGGGFAAKKAEDKAHQKLRENWLNSKNELISEKYKEFIFLKIPINKIKESLRLNKVFRQKLAIFDYNNNKITLQGNTFEFQRLKKYDECIKF